MGVRAARSPEITAVTGPGCTRPCAYVVNRRLVATQMPVEFEVRRRALGLDVDEQLQGAAVTPVDGTVVGLHPGRERVEVEGFEGAGRVEVGRVVGDEELVADQVDVGLDAAEAVVEGVEEGSGVLVVVVGVGAPQRDRVLPLLARQRA